MDEAWALPSEKAVRIALRTQQILAHESGAINTIDPLGGSYFLENLTDQMEEEAYKYFDKIESLGGVISAIDKGFFQKEIADAAYKYQKEIEKKDRVIVGVNDYLLKNEDLSIPLLKMDPEGEVRQFQRLKKMRAERDNGKWEKSLEKLQAAAEGDENLMPYILDAAKAYATLGEICDTMRDVFGEYEDFKPTYLPLIPQGFIFKLREKSLLIIRWGKIYIFICSYPRLLDNKC
jgi:methylmalonyl-CoA mutase N-terminal domain/subunit